MLCLLDAFGKGTEQTGTRLRDAPIRIRAEERQKRTDGVHECYDLEDATDETRFCDTTARHCESFLQSRA